MNRVATKVDLRFDLESTTALGEEVKARLRRLHANRIDAQGRLIVTSESGRTQARNLGICRAKLAEMIAAALVRPKKRRATKPSRAARARRLEHKRKRGEKKSLRGRVRGE